MNNQPHSHHWTCCVCGKGAAGCGLIIDEPQASVNHRVCSEQLTHALYFQPRGSRMHPACIERLKNYFLIRDRNATTSKSVRPTLSLKK